MTIKTRDELKALWQVGYKIRESDYDDLFDSVVFTDELSGLDIGNSTILNLSGSGSDYLLKVGETAYIDYTDATSVPLRIQTEEGLYELEILGDVLGSTYSGGGDNTYLIPNSGGLGASVINCQRNLGTGSSITTYKFDLSSFMMGVFLLCQISSKILTKTTNKSIRVYGNSIINSDSPIIYDISSRWNNDSTPWTSLGTIIFPFVQSGKIIIKRVI